MDTQEAGGRKEGAEGEGVGGAKKAGREEATIKVLSWSHAQIFGMISQVNKKRNQLCMTRRSPARPPRCLCRGFSYTSRETTLGISRIYSVFGREITKYTVIYSVYIRFWPTLRIDEGTDLSVCWLDVPEVGDHGRDKKELLLAVNIKRRSRNNEQHTCR
jgi:hypothetical protein